MPGGVDLGRVVRDEVWLVFGGHVHQTACQLCEIKAYQLDRAGFRIACSTIVNRRPKESILILKPSIRVEACIRRQIVLLFRGARVTLDCICRTEQNGYICCIR